MKLGQNHAVYLDILRRLSPEDRLRKAFELSELSRSLFEHGLHRAFPDLEAAELRALAIYEVQHARLDQNYLAKWAKLLGAESQLARIRREADLI